MTEGKERDRAKERDRDLRQRPPLPFSVSVPFPVFLFGVLITVASLLIVSCGRKGPPRAPELAVPETIKDLKAEAGGGGIALTWSRPTRYLDGKSLDDLAGFVVFRKEITQACPECPAPYRQRVTLNVEDQQKFLKKQKFRYVDGQLTPQVSYSYRVFSRLMDGSLSETSNEAKLTWSP